MIIIDHLLIGAAIGIAIDPNKPEIIGITILGSILPDIDTLLAKPGSINYLIKHRTVTHSLFLSPIYALIIALIFKLIFFDQTFIVFFSCAFIGILSHLLVDAFNSFGTMLFYPFNNNKIALDLIYEFDPFISLLFLLMTFEFYFFSNKISTLVLVLNLLAILSYYLSRIISKKMFAHKMKKQFPVFMTNVENPTIVPAKYWRWKAIVIKNNSNHILRTINKELVIESRSIREIPECFMNSDIQKYKDYARVLDVYYTESELVLKNLIYSPSVYTLRMGINGPNSGEISISLPNIKYDDY